MIAREVAEDGDVAVRFDARRQDDLDAGGDEFFELSPEVVDAKKEADAAGVLVADDCFLPLAVRAREKKASVASARAHDDPPFRLAAAGASFASVRPFSAARVQAFAKRGKIAPGIVVGRLQHERLLPFNQLNHLKRRLQCVDR